MRADQPPKSIAPDPLAIYIHWPYCESKCPYCDFNSHARRSVGEDQYVSSVISELQYYADQTRGRAISSIFFGGGTPSLMAVNSVATVLDTISALWPVQETCEITLEANPSSVEASRFAGYRAAGVNRVSLGIQSLRDEQLRFLGRLHTASEAVGALKIAGKLFNRVSFDLIYARPDQSEGAWEAELEQALDLARGHLSLYQLTIEPETAFFQLQSRGKLRIPGMDLAADLYGITQKVCERAGLRAYEISNHAIPGEESRHNLSYWRYDDYLGVGPGAHGRVTHNGKKYATAAIKDPSAWHLRVVERGNGCDVRAELDAREQAEEMVLMGLRLREGMSEDELERRTGFRPAQAEIAALESDTLVEREAGRIKLSAQGLLVLNPIVTAIAASLEKTPSGSILRDRSPEA